jgi:hypothetical protein
MASEMNKSKRKISCQFAIGDGTEVVWQAISYSKMFDVGFLHLIHGKITILPVNRDTPKRQRGSLEVASSRNGNRPDQDPFCGFMGNVSPPTSTLLW